MNKLTWKERQAIEIQDPRVIVSMQPKAMKPYCKAATNRTSGRNKYGRGSPLKAKAMQRGRMKQLRLIRRGIELNRKPNFMKSTSVAVKKALGLI